MRHSTNASTQPIISPHTSKQAIRRSGVVHLTVTAAHDGQRIDNYLFTQLKQVPKSQIYRWLRKGEIRVNAKRAKPQLRLQTADCLRLPPMFLPEVSQTPVSQHTLNVQVQRLTPLVVFEDAQVIVLNKPSGLAVHGGSGVSLGAVEIMRAMTHNPDLSLVHRLDQPTSGCLVFAKSRNALLTLHHAFRHGKVKKVYDLCLHGLWQGKRQRIINQPLRKQVLKSGERMVTVDASGKPAHTMFQWVKNLANHCLVKAYPTTGRTHQIRVHAQSMGQPILGDSKYMLQEKRQGQTATTVSRLMLHAAAIRFSGEFAYDFSAAPPEDWHKQLQQLEQGD